MQNTKQNRVTPKGELVADPSYGTFMGNRGILHDAAGAIGHRRWRHRNWIICLTEFKGRKRPIMAPNSYTELFFLDEATALAAGHRPCAECRYTDYVAYRGALERAGGLAASEHAATLDAELHEQRAWPRLFRQRTWQADLSDLPDGTMFEDTGRCLLVAGPWLLEWSFQGYRIAAEKALFGARTVTVLTPKATVTALIGGYQPAVHRSAADGDAGVGGAHPVFAKLVGQKY